MEVDKQQLRENQNASSTVEFVIMIPDCVGGWFGKNCLEECSGHCAGSQHCDVVDGHCPNGCQDWWSGDKCDTFIGRSINIHQKRK